MTNAETIWNVISRYYGNSTAIGLFLILTTVYLLGEKKEYRYYTLSCSMLLLLLLNQLTYRLITNLGEGSTYYRFLWMFPVSLIAAWILLVLLEKMESKVKGTICVVCVIFLILMYSNAKLSDWITLPENIYQLSEDKIQLADLIDDVAGGQRATVYAEDELLYGIREYNANICLTTEGEAARLAKQKEKEELEKKYNELFGQKNFGFKRLMKAFPDMTSREQNESLEKYKKYFNIRKPDHKKDK